MFTKNGWPVQVSETLKPYWNRRLELSLEVIVPKKWQKRVLEELHQVHFGIARTKAIARGYVWWPELNKQVETKELHIVSKGKEHFFCCTAPSMH